MSYNREYYLANKEKIKQQSKERYHANKEKASIEHKQYYQKNKNKILKQAKEYRNKHRETINACTKQWHKDNKKRSRVSILKAIEKQKNRNNRLIDIVKTYYKCMNPQCCWQGDIPHCCLDFHHQQPKSFSVGNSKTVSLVRMIAEINKCIILCANCHRKTTHGLLDVSGIHCCNIADIGYIQ